LGSLFAEEPLQSLLGVGGDEGGVRALGEPAGQGGKRRFGPGSLWVDGDQNAQN